MRIIGQPLEAVAREDTGRLHFQYRGNLGALVQGGFFLAIAGILAFTELGLVMRIFGVLGAVWSVGALVSWLGALDLSIDLPARTYEVLRGRVAPRGRTAGSLDDLLKVYVAPGSSSAMHVFLIPRGSRRGYDLQRGLEREAARTAGQALAARLGLPFEELQPDARVIPSVDLLKVPELVPILSTPLPDGVELTLSRRGSIRATFAGLEAAGTRMEWRDLTQVEIGLVTPAHRRFRPRWRQDMTELWADRCGERKEPGRPVPSWGPLWFAYEGSLLESQRTIHIYRSGHVRESVGSNWTLTDDGLEWLLAGLVTYGRAHGGTFIAGSI